MSRQQAPAEYIIGICNLEGREDLPRVIRRLKFDNLDEGQEYSTQCIARYVEALIAHFKPMLVEAGTTRASYGMSELSEYLSLLPVCYYENDDLRSTQDLVLPQLFDLLEFLSQERKLELRENFVKQFTLGEKTTDPAKKWEQYSKENIDKQLITPAKQRDYYTQAYYKLYEIYITQLNVIDQNSDVGVRSEACKKLHAKIDVLIPKYAPTLKQAWEKFGNPDRYTPHDIKGLLAFAEYIIYPEQHASLSAVLVDKQMRSTAKIDQSSIPQLFDDYSFTLMLNQATIEIDDKRRKLANPALATPTSVNGFIVFQTPAKTSPTKGGSPEAGASVNGGASGVDYASREHAKRKLKFDKDPVVKEDSKVEDRYSQHAP